MAEVIFFSNKLQLKVFIFDVNDYFIPNSLLRQKD